jgi:hypothetical protein
VRSPVALAASLVNGSPRRWFGVYQKSHCLQTALGLNAGIDATSAADRLGFRPKFGYVRARNRDLPRGHADSAVEPHIFAIEVCAGNHGVGELGIFFGAAEPLGEGHGRGERGFHVVGCAL